MNTWVASGEAVVAILLWVCMMLLRWRQAEHEKATAAMHARLYELGMDVAAMIERLNGAKPRAKDGTDMQGHLDPDEEGFVTYEDPDVYSTSFGLPGAEVDDRLPDERESDMR